MKKIFSVLLITTIVTTLGSPVYASSENPNDLQAVSYTHLTLPTIA